MMATQAVTVELPEVIVSLIGSPENMEERIRETLVFDLLRKGEASQGGAARLLGVSRYDLLDLMVAHQIPAAPRMVEDAQIEVDTIERLAHLS
jgi:predicted HTH domain antitoxin